jgi:hypothetical protein
VMLVFAVALFYSLVVLNNTTHYSSSAFMADLKPRIPSPIPLPTREAF